MRYSRTLTVLLSLGAVLAAVPSLAAKGVDHVEFDPAYTNCFPGQALPCLPDSGEGGSNIVYVHQREVGGQYVFDELHVPGIPDDHFWVAANVGAECKTGYHLLAGFIAPGWYDASGEPGAYHGLPYGASAGIWIGGGEPKTLPNHIVNIQVPVDAAFQPDLITTNVFGFWSRDEIFAFGESRIASRVADGWTEEAARKQSFPLDTYIAMHGYIACKGNWLGREYFMSRSAWLPLRFVFVGVAEMAELQPQEPGVPEPPVDGLTAGIAVTQAFLHVAPDPDDACRLRLTGAFTTNGETEISYRFVDELGLESQTFTTQVDQTHVSMIDHYVDLPVIERPDGEIDDFFDEGRGGIGGLNQRPTDNAQGYYQIEVRTPHGYWSNVADYNVEPCYEDSFVPGGLRAPSRALPPGHPVDDLAG